jgi:hypothetical protein
MFIEKWTRLREGERERVRGGGFCKDLRAPFLKMVFYGGLETVPKLKFFWGTNGFQIHILIKSKFIYRVYSQQQK